MTLYAYKRRRVGNKLGTEMKSKLNKFCKVPTCIDFGLNFTVISTVCIQFNSMIRFQIKDCPGP